MVQTKKEESSSSSGGEDNTEKEGFQLENEETVPRKNEGEDEDDYDGHDRHIKHMQYMQQMKYKDIRDIKFGNSQSKIVQFHKGQNTIHEADREKGSSIVANLSLAIK